MIEKPHPLSAKLHLNLGVGDIVDVVGVGIAGEGPHPAPPGGGGRVLLGGRGLQELGDGLEHDGTEGRVLLGPGVRRAN